jgi:hypothetical protein
MKDIGITCVDGDGNIVTPVLTGADIKKMENNPATQVIIGR